MKRLKNVQVSTAAQNNILTTQKDKNCTTFLRLSALNHNTSADYKSFVDIINSEPLNRFWHISRCKEFKPYTSESQFDPKAAINDKLEAKQ